MSDGSYDRFTGRERDRDHGDGGNGGNQGNRIFDKRRPDRITVPSYVIRDYGAQLKPYALAVYLCLCFHVSRERVVFPSYGLIGSEIGCSRKTVERAMKDLKASGLVIVEPRFDGKRQTSNNIYLVDPGTRPEDVITAPPAPQGAPTIGQGGADQEAAPAPPISRRPPCLEDGAEVFPEEVDPKGEGAHPPEAAPDDKSETRELALLWMELLACPVSKLRAEHRREIVVACRELMRRGYTPEHLAEAMRAPDRDRSEYPRHFLARVGRAKPPKRPRQNAQPVDLGKQAAEEADVRQAYQRTRAAGGFMALARRAAAGEDVRPLLLGGIGEENKG